VTTEQALPVLKSYCVAMPDGLLFGARLGPRDRIRNLALLRLDTVRAAVNPEIAAASVGSLVVVLGADAQGAATVRVSVVHRVANTNDGPAAVLDLPSERVDPGSLVMDADGRLIGLAALSPNGETMAIPAALIGRMLTSKPALESAQPPRAADCFPSASDRRAWLGVSLQPITVPDQLVARTGQTSGRMVVSITKGGPAEQAGLRVGDVLLALNGTSASGPNTLRALLASERVGKTVDVRLLRDGSVMTAALTLTVHPGSG
jgi:S1-C subfamily serine protease